MIATKEHRTENTQNGQPARRVDSNKGVRVAGRGTWNKEERQQKRRKGHGEGKVVGEGFGQSRYLAHFVELACQQKLGQQIRVVLDRGVACDGGALSLCQGAHAHPALSAQQQVGTAGQGSQAVDGGS